MTYKTYREAGTVAGYLNNNTNHRVYTVRANGLYHVWLKGRKATPKDLQPRPHDVAAFTRESATKYARHILDTYSDDGMTGATVAPHPDGDPHIYAITLHISEAHFPLTINDFHALI